MAGAFLYALTLLCREGVACPTAALERSLGAPNLASLERAARRYDELRTPECAVELFTRWLDFRDRVRAELEGSAGALDDERLPARLSPLGWRVTELEAGPVLESDGTSWLARRFGPSLPDPWTDFLYGLERPEETPDEVRLHLRFWEDFTAANPHFPRIAKVKREISLLLQFFLLAYSDKRVVPVAFRRAYQDYVADEKARYRGLVGDYNSRMEKNGFRLSESDIDFVHIRMRKLGLE
jgi:hypothetical protein